MACQWCKLCKCSSCVPRYWFWVPYKWFFFIRLINLIYCTWQFNLVWHQSYQDNTELYKLNQRGKNQMNIIILESWFNGSWHFQKSLDSFSFFFFSWENNSSELGFWSNRLTVQNSDWNYRCESLFRIL